LTRSAVRQGYRIEKATRLSEGERWTIVSPAGVRLYSFASQREAEREAAVLNTAPRTSGS
jgi:hypothetical protein